MHYDVCYSALTNTLMPFESSFGNGRKKSWANSTSEISVSYSSKLNSRKNEANIR